MTTITEDCMACNEFQHFGIADTCPGCRKTKKYAALTEEDLAVQEREDFHDKLDGMYEYALERMAEQDYWRSI